MNIPTEVNEVIGWVGAIAVILAYLLVSLHKVDGKSFKFQLLNFIGAGLLIIYTINKEAFASAFVNIIWTGIALYSIIKNRGKN
jgi:hypothetical protein